MGGTDFNTEMYNKTYQKMPSQELLTNTQWHILIQCRYDIDIFFIDINKEVCSYSCKFVGLLFLFDSDSVCYNQRVNPRSEFMLENLESVTKTYVKDVAHGPLDLNIVGIKKHKICLII